MAKALRESECEIVLARRSGAALYDIGDPDHRCLLARMAETLTARYAWRPALFAIGFDNEIGNGHLSYSPDDRERLVEWPKHGYGSIEALNKAWATQLVVAHQRLGRGAAAPRRGLRSGRAPSGSSPLLVRHHHRCKDRP